MTVAGERDADRRVVENRLALQPLALGTRHVATVDHEVLAPFHAEARGRHQQREVAALPVAEHHRQIAHLAALAHQGHEALARIARAPDAELHRGAADGLVARPARQGHEGVVDHHVAAGDDVGQRDQVGAGGDHVRQQRLAALARQLRAQPLGLVAIDRQDRGAALGLDVDAGHLHREAPAGRGVQPELLRRRRLAHRQRGQPGGAARGQLARAVALLVERQQRLADQLAGRPGAEQRQRGHVGVEHAAVAVQHQRRWRAREQLAVARLGGPALQLGLALGCDVAPHAPIAGEHAAVVEARTPAHGQPVVTPVRADASQHQRRERAPRLEVGAQGVHRVRVEPEAVDVPGRAADAPLDGQCRHAGALLGHVGEAQLRVHLPVPVGRHGQQADEALFAATQAGHGGVQRAPHELADHGAGQQQRDMAGQQFRHLVQRARGQQAAGHFQRRQQREEQALSRGCAQGHAARHQRRCRQQHRHEAQGHQPEALPADQGNRVDADAAHAQRQGHRAHQREGVRPQRQRSEHARHDAADDRRPARRSAGSHLGRHVEKHREHQRHEHADDHEQAHRGGVVAAPGIGRVATRASVVRDGRHGGALVHPGPPSEAPRPGSRAWPGPRPARPARSRPWRRHTEWRETS